MPLLHRCATQFAFFGSGLAEYGNPESRARSLPVSFGHRSSYLLVGKDDF